MQTRGGSRSSSARAAPALHRVNDKPCTEGTFSLLHGSLNPEEPLPALVICAHPDDEQIFAGSFLARHPGSIVVCATTGLDEGRMEEARCSALQMRVAAWYQGTQHGQQLCGCTSPSLDALLAQLAPHIDPTRVLTHNVRGEYGHPQHKGVHRAVLRAAQLHGWTVHSFGLARRKLSQEEAIRKKRIFLQCYPSQADQARHLHGYFRSERTPL